MPPPHPHDPGTKTFHTHTHTLTRVKGEELLPRSEHLGLLESDAPRDVDVKEMHLECMGTMTWSLRERCKSGSVPFCTFPAYLQLVQRQCKYCTTCPDTSQEWSLSIKANKLITYQLLLAPPHHRHTSDQVDFALLGHRGQELGGLPRDGLSVVGEVAHSIGGVEAFLQESWSVSLKSSCFVCTHWKGYELGSVKSSLSHEGAGSLQVGRLACPHCKLDKSQLEFAQTCNSRKK